jgi:type I restriction enzyme S subunit
MSADQLLAYFDRVADAPDAIDRLRKFIVDLAVRGKLVPQDPSDEPASELLNRKSSVERLRQLPGKSDDSVNAATFSPRESPWNVPASWAWVGLGQIINKHFGGGTPSKSNPSYWNGDIPWASVKDVGRSKYLDDTIDRITIEGLQYSSSNLIPSGCLIVVTRMGLGKISINRVPLAINQDLRALSISAVVEIDYAYLFMKTLDYRGTGLTVKGIRINELLSTQFPLPPLAEQRRIIARVDELLALCGRLEVTRAERESRRKRLTAASLARLNAPYPETFRDDVRFVLDTLPALTTRPDQIKQFRQAILNLAVRGKLVSQHVGDAPASQLVEQIAEAKAERKAQTGDARIQVAQTPEPSKLPMDLPSGWAVQSFENLFLFIDYRGSTPPKTDSGVPLITAKNVRMGFLQQEPREYIAQSTFDRWMTRGFPRKGDLFFTTEAPLANVCRNDISEPFALAQRIICLQPFGRIDTKFMMFALMSDLLQSMIGAHATGLTAKGIKSARLKPLPLPIPPLAEQRRIVARVDQLTALCDQLEVSLSISEANRARLLEALLAEALRPAEVAGVAAVA